MGKEDLREMWGWVGGQIGAHWDGAWLEAASAFPFPSRMVKHVRQVKLPFFMRLMPK